MTFSEYWEKNEPFGSNPDEVAELAWNAAIATQLARLEKCRADYAKVQEYWQIDRDRLEKCEVVIDKYQASHNLAWMSGPCQCSNCDAARAALDGITAPTTKELSQPAG